MEFLLDTVYVNAHKLNIYLHIITATTATALGVSQLVNKKGSRLHRDLGRLFVRCFTIVVATATLGLILFELRAFLVVLTLAAAYSGLSGYRVLVLRGSRPLAFDNAISVLTLFASFSFIFAIEYFQLTFSKATIFASIGSLATMCLFDISRNFLPDSFLKRSWLNEHIVKMISTLSALLSAASGNLLPNFGALSQLTPIVLCSILTIGFLFWPKVAQRSPKVLATSD